MNVIAKVDYKMGQWLYLRVGDKEIGSWKYEIPESTIQVLNFFFKPLDKVIIQERKEYHCIYRTTIGELKERLKESRLNKEELEQTLNHLLKIPVSKLDIALMDEDTFFERYGQNEKMQDEKYKYDEIISSCDIGEYPFYMK